CLTMWQKNKLIWDIRKRTFGVDEKTNFIQTNNLDRLEFVQRLKLEASLDVHYGCVSKTCKYFMTVSAAGDGNIHYTNITRSPEFIQYNYTCHHGTAYQVIFLPTVPYYLALGCTDSSDRIQYDRRILGTISTGIQLFKGPETWNYMCVRFVPPNLAGHWSCRVTSLCYSSDGREVLASFSSDYVYLFDPKDDKASKLKELPKNKGEGLLCAPVKRLKMRGDWSDTGPQLSLSFLKYPFKCPFTPGSITIKITIMMTTLVSTHVDNNVLFIISVCTAAVSSDWLSMFYYLLSKKNNYESDSNYIVPLWCGLPDFHRIIMVIKT
uniref:Uncharacterized protein n=1 Tax=Cyprinus carpio TaxID=7962 RepID=A0A8C1P697_CYPCA